MHCDGTRGDAEEWLGEIYSATKSMIWSWPFPSLLAHDRMWLSQKTKSGIFLYCGKFETFFTLLAKAYKSKTYTI